MRYLQTKLYSLAVPLVLLPVMDMSVSQLPDYLRGNEFRNFLTEIIIQLVTGVVDAFIALFLGGLFAGGG
ncbi:MAG: hypothetical protein ACYTF1_02750 [Planctomycetota bacterium]|jgi:hypothetical protein